MNVEMNELYLFIIAIMLIVTLHVYLRISDKRQEENWARHNKNYKESDTGEPINKQAECSKQELGGNSGQKVYGKSHGEAEGASRKKPDTLASELYRKPEIKVWEGKKTSTEGQYYTQYDDRIERNATSKKYNVRCTGICADCRRDVCLEDKWNSRNQN